MATVTITIIMGIIMIPAAITVVTPAAIRAVLMAAGTVVAVITNE